MLDVRLEYEDDSMPGIKCCSASCQLFFLFILAALASLIVSHGCIPSSIHPSRAFPLHLLTLPPPPPWVHRCVYCIHAVESTARRHIPTSSTILVLIKRPMATIFTRPMATIYMAARRRRRFVHGGGDGARAMNRAENGVPVQTNFIAQRKA